VRLNQGESLFSGRSVRVPDGQGAKIVWPDQTAIWLAGNAEVSLLATDITSLQFQKGRLLASVRPVEPGKSFRVYTALGTVVVHGTAFSVSGDGDRIALRLHEGVVTFEHAGDSVTLAPGSELVMQKGRSFQVRRMDDTGVLADLMIAEKTADLEGPPVPILGRQFEMSTIDIVANKPAAPVVETAPTERLKKRRAKPPKPALSDAGDIVGKKQGDDLFLDPDLEAIEVESVDVIQDKDPTALIESMIQKSRYISCIRAAETYLDTHPKGTFAERVHFLKGYCQTRSGNLKAGREAFETYLIRFPEGRYWKRVSDILGE
jgi:hypothetical protein